MELPLAAPAGFRVIAHRGASAYAPENTLSAFALAVRMGARDIELDAQLSGDGRVVICHDEVLTRYGHGDLRVAELTLAELQALDMGAWFSPFLYAGERMLTLDALFAVFGARLTYHLELKSHQEALAAAVWAEIRRHGLAGRVVCTSFHAEQLERMAAVAPELPRGWLVREAGPDTLARARTAGLRQLCPNARAVTPTLVAEARGACPEVRAWGLTGSRAEVLALARQVLAAGCDGMTLDYPDWVRAEA